MPPERSQLLQGTLDMLILQIVAIGPVHGYAINQRIQQISREALSVQHGSLYPALHRLEARGQLSAEWRETEGGRMAKYYSLTRHGRKQLDIEKKSWSRLTNAIELILAARAEEF